MKLYFILCLLLFSLNTILAQEFRFHVVFISCKEDITSKFDVVNAAMTIRLRNAVNPKVYEDGAVSVEPGEEIPSYFLRENDSLFLVFDSSKVTTRSGDFYHLFTEVDIKDKFKKPFEGVILRLGYGFVPKNCKRSSLRIFIVPGKAYANNAILKEYANDVLCNILVDFSFYNEDCLSEGGSRQSGMLFKSGIRNKAIRSMKLLIGDCDDELNILDDF